jgi:sortase (surface protein transpeptidase)
MSEPTPIGLDSPVFDGRLRLRREGSLSVKKRYYVRPLARYFDPQSSREPPAPTSSKAVEVPVPIWMQPLSTRNESATEPEILSPADPEPITLVGPSPFVFPATVTKQSRFKIPKSQLLQRLPRLNRLPDPHRIPEALRSLQYTRLQIALASMAAFLFVLGITVSFQALRTNHNAAAQVSALSKKANGQEGNNQNSSVPSTTKPSNNAVRQYMVAPDLPRYIKIPKLGVNARVFQVGVTKTGALGTPSNVFDAAWYTGSAKPGQPGAMLIDGHVSGWTTHGVFYGLKKLVAGDTIQIQRGDGAVLTYKVIKSQVYPDNKVDMQAAVTTVTAGRPGLNLITCTGKIKPGTNEFNQRMIVFTEQV